MQPGHTHCDVDARFGNFSTFLNSRECGSPQELISAFKECIPGQAIMKQTIYDFKSALTQYCNHYGTLKSMYDFHLYLDGNNVPMVENARFHLSETLLCGQRQNEETFTTQIFKEKKFPPLDLNFQIESPKTEGLESMEPNIRKWESVITAAAKNDLLQLKDEITSHVGTPFLTLLQTIQSKEVPLETLHTDDSIPAAEAEVEAEEIVQASDEEELSPSDAITGK
jgi:hypothetical protein